MGSVLINVQDIPDSLLIFVRAWWRHARQQDLEDAKIYESVRATIAQNLQTDFFMAVQGIAQNRAIRNFHAFHTSPVIWS